MTMILAIDNIQAYLMQSVHNLCNAGTLCIERHQHERVRSPQKPATSYLRAAVRIARQMANSARRYPMLWESALALLDQVAEEMDDAEQQLFRSGGNTSGYAVILAQVEGLRIEIVEHYRKELEDRSLEVEGEAVEVHVAVQPTMDRRRVSLRPKMPYPERIAHSLDLDVDDEDDDYSPEALPQAPTAQRPTANS